jgi:hypothetical protein
MITLQTLGDLIHGRLDCIADEHSACVLWWSKQAQRFKITGYGNSYTIPLDWIANPSAKQIRRHVAAFSGV